LVHGDYFPENVILADDGRVCGVIDFGALTLIGDADLDLACAVLNLTGMVGVTPEDRRVALKRAEALGLEGHPGPLWPITPSTFLAHCARTMACSDGACEPSARRAVRGDCEELRRHGHFC
jgi:hypothetical protein